MSTLVFGRGDATCSYAQTGPNIGMCDVFHLVQPENVIVRYQYTGLGYAGRPGVSGNTAGPVPTITVSLTGINFSFFFLSDLIGLPPMAIPGLHTTITGEDLGGT
jgi:hypothetical protein